MEKKYKRAIFIFRRDLRLDDNTALLAALERAEKVLTCFVIDPRQVERHPFRSEHALEFMDESLRDLASQLILRKGKLHLYHGKPQQVLAELYKAFPFQAVFVNADYTPFSTGRDRDIEKMCKKLGVDFHSLHDLLLCRPEQALKKNGIPYTIFTPFYKKVLPQLAPSLHKNNYTNYVVSDAFPTIGSLDEVVPLTKTKNIAVQGGRAAGKRLLAKALETQKSYEATHDIPHLPTSQLSAHNKFGTLSIREVFHAFTNEFGQNSPQVRQLLWRDFFTLIGYYFPRVFGHAFNEKYEHIAWRSDKKLFTAWQQGLTGFPLVDAGMRELNQTGFMHNRVRMVVASFLTKDLHIDWREGERYFAQKLVDYDPAVNNGSWQWVASTGCDAQPYFRVFNPWLQQKKFDRDALYIKRWVPELKELSAAHIHRLYDVRVPLPPGYVRPIVDHAQAARYTKKLFTQ